MVAFIELATGNVRTRGLFVPPDVDRSGIYRLTFANGDTYWGGTHNIVLRVGSHRRAYDDIAAISFCPVPAAELDSAIREHEHHIDANPRVRTRNRAMRDSGIGMWARIDPNLERIRWIEENVSGFAYARQAEPPDQRERTLTHFQRLSSHTEFEALRKFVSSYIKRIIPAPEVSERRNWVITSMPSTARTRVWHRLICLSVNNVEALTIGEQYDGGKWVVTGFMSAAGVAGNARVAVPAAARRKGAFIAPVYYRTVGDVSQIGFDSLAALKPLLDSDRVLDLVGELVLRLMWRGRGMYGRFHDYNLADAVLHRERPIASEDRD